MSINLVWLCFRLLEGLKISSLPFQDGVLQLNVLCSARLSTWPRGLQVLLSPQLGSLTQVMSLLQLGPLLPFSCSCLSSAFVEKCSSRCPAKAQTCVLSCCQSQHPVRFPFHALTASLLFFTSLLPLDASGPNLR